MASSCVVSYDMSTTKKPDRLQQLWKREREVRCNLNSTITRDQRKAYTLELGEILNERRALCTTLDIRKISLI